jgi:hypothetical protein
MTGAERALSRSDDDRVDKAWDELCERAHDREFNPAEDTPALDPPWSVDSRCHNSSVPRGGLHFLGSILLKACRSSADIRCQ